MICALIFPIFWQSFGQSRRTYRIFFVILQERKAKGVPFAVSVRKSKIYKITIEDESHLTELVTMRTSFMRLCFFAAVATICLVALAGAIVAFTPLRTLLPGYMKESQRSATEEGLLRLDSLMQAFEENEQYLRNYLTVTDTERVPADSAKVIPVSREFTSDSLRNASELERNFVEGMEERERFNISVLAPLAADEVSFSPVTTEGVFTTASRTSTSGKVILTSDESVQCPADGAVIAIYRSSSEGGYVTVVQHRRGFVTACSGTGTPLVGVGDQVSAGQVMALAPTPDNRGQRSFTIRMWHNSVALVPYDYLGDPGRRQSSLGESFEAPRGR